MGSSNHCSRSAGNVPFTLELLRSSKPEENSNVVKLEILPLKGSQILKCQEKKKLESSHGRSYSDRHHRLMAGDEFKVPPKSLKISQKFGKVSEESNNDELVKHMSNLPSYLQRMEKGENSQEKALNFGVLDWERLEEWKYKKHPLPGGNTNVSPTGENSSFKANASLKLSSHVQSQSLIPQKKQPSSYRPQLKESHEGSFSQDVKQARGKVRQDFRAVYKSSMKPSSSIHGPNRVVPNDSSCVLPCSNKEPAILAQGKCIDKNPLCMKSSTVKESDTSKRLDNEATEPAVVKGSNSSDNHRLSFSLGKISRSSGFEESSTLPQLSSNCAIFKSGSVGSEASDSVSSEEVHPVKEYSDTLHLSCRPQLNGSHEGGFFQEVKQTQGKVSRQDFQTVYELSGREPSSSIHGWSRGVSNDSSSVFPCSNKGLVISTQGKCIEKNPSTVKPSSSPSFEPLTVKPSRGKESDVSKRLDNEATEPAVVKGSSSSDNRRFRFSFGKISRSSSFKESSTLPQLSSKYTIFKSGPVRSEASDYFSSEQFPSAKVYSEMLHSCPVPAGIETRANSNNLTAAQGMGLSNDAAHLFYNPNGTQNKSSAGAILTSKPFDEATGVAAKKGRHPSPNRRFSFSLGKMGRSLSLKETSSVPALSNTYASFYSGPMSSEEPGICNTANRNKINIHNRVRSSPLRRLLDPILKGRGTKPCHSADGIQSSTRNLNSTFEVISSTGSLQDKKHEASISQALLQLTVKNGLPLFKLVANNNSDILVALRKLTGSSKDDASWVYTFYSVQETKKKSGSWINQGHKGRSYDFGYDTVGQMKVFSSNHPDLTIQSSKDQFTEVESVLYGVDIRQAGQETQELVPNRELAAIIVKTPSGNSSDDSDPGKKCKKLTGREFMKSSQEGRTSCRKQESEKCSSIRVILPGGVHSLPSTGVPSPLIKRWKAGGSCDCGGWDVGCKLRILTSEDQSCKMSRPSTSCPEPDHFDLFNEGGGPDEGPMLSLTTFKKGIFSVEFDASISMLQAFSTSVAVISSQKVFDFSDENHLSDEKLLNESTLTGNNGIKAPTEVRREVPIRYVPSLPPSPVGRV
ncbi:uncharacterized protein LOC127787964 [Diospyros lotus]|uniref:uncharacterized protein LOC127787964 n=1 Tax=Diospyros lotus TaxID=55363 RepID=UPI002250C1B8|nr:uncharacterized protein LOC127787964 [Diospyros lotus]